MTTPQRTQPQQPPAAGKTLSVRIDAALYDDLAVIMRAGGTASDAVRTAVRHLADVYRAAWDYGDVPDGTAPHILAVRYAAADGTPAVVRPSYGQVTEAPADSSRAA
ncbi:hypothetical protein PV318_03235 [Streptomyces sp. ME02-6991-2B]|nr:hypothetical protein [Streptomyces sp. ME02-6991-2B]